MKRGPNHSMDFPVRIWLFVAVAFAAIATGYAVTTVFIAGEKSNCNRHDQFWIKTLFEC